VYIYWFKRLYTEWVLGLCNWIKNYFSTEHQFTVDGYLICVCVCVSVCLVRGSSFHCAQKKWSEVYGITTLQGVKSQKSADLIYLAAEPWYHAQYVFQIILTINRHCFPTQHRPIDLSNGSTLYSLRDAGSIYADWVQFLRGLISIQFTSIWVSQQPCEEIFFNFVVLAILLTAHTETCGPVN
jgi:hypothetical protein